MPSTYEVCKRVVRAAHKTKIWIPKLKPPKESSARKSGTRFYLMNSQYVLPSSFNEAAGGITGHVDEYPNSANLTLQSGRTSAPTLE